MAQVYGLGMSKIQDFVAMFTFSRELSLGALHFGFDIFISPEGIQLS